MPPSGGNSKIVLPLFQINDPSIEAAVTEVSDCIMKKKRGFMWPVTKITFCKQADNLLLDVTAIDNTWSRLFENKEDVYGYFIVKNRIFVVASKGEEEVNLNPFFLLTDQSKVFYMPGMTAPPPANPIWCYQYKDNAIALIKSQNLDVLE